MKKFLTTVFVLFTCLCLCCSLASCNDGATNELNNNTDSEASAPSGNTTTIEADSVEDLEEAIEKDIADTINQLNKKWQVLKTQITTYDEYVKKSDDVENFYNEVNNNIEKACIRLQKYTLQYAELIMDSNASHDDKYDAFADLLECIYEEAAENLHEEIYEDLFNALKDSFYDGVLKDSDTGPSYSEWYDTRSDEYSNWYDTRSDVYDNWYDTRSDIYDFYYDMRGELWDNDMERAEKIFDGYKKDVENLT